MPLKYQQESLKASVYIYNITPHSSLGFKSPFELLYNKKPNLNNIKIWGSICYYLIKTQITKLEPKAKKAILVGYNQYNYYVLDLEANKII